MMLDLDVWALWICCGVDLLKFIFLDLILFLGVFFFLDYKYIC